MSSIPPKRLDIQQEESRFRFAVSESIAFKLGSSINFVNHRQFDQKEFFLNGPYGEVASPPVLGLDGLYVFPFDAEIINIATFNLVNGSSGTTELDVKLATTSGGAFTSMFATTPKIDSSAGDNAFFLAYIIADIPTGQSWTPNPSLPTGTSGGILTSVPFPVSAGNAIRVDLLDRMPGAENCGLIIHHRPR